MTLQKKIRCRICDKMAKDHNRAKIAVDGVEVFICEACMDKERNAMLNDPAHPAWAYYNAVAQALYGKTKTDD